MLQTIKKLLPYFLLSFYRKNLKKFHGNELLDKKMLKYINYKNGFYIEIGAHDGILNSNTYYYEKNLNWRGVLVEPSNYFKNLKKNRSKRNLFYKKICVPFKFKKKISFEQIGPYSRSNDLISTKYLKWHKTKSDEVKNIYKKTVNKNIKTSNLNDILKISKAPKLIDFFSLDVEGVEYEVLTGIDHSTYRFKYILVECRDFNKINNYLLKNNYIFIEKLSKKDYLFSIKN